MQLKTTEEGDSLKCLSKLVLLYPERVTKVTLKLLPFCTMRSEIPIIDICKQLMDSIKEKNYEKGKYINVFNKSN